MFFEKIKKTSEKLLTNQNSCDRIANSYGTKPKEDEFGPLAQLVRATGSYPVSLGFESLRAHHLPYYNLIDRGIVQLVEQRSPKPFVVGSNPTAPAKKKAIRECGWLFSVKFAFGE